MLKPGGELYFSDVYATRRVPDELVKNKVLFGECLSGALYYNDFIRLAHKSGFIDPRLVSSSRIILLTLKPFGKTIGVFEFGRFFP